MTAILAPTRAFSATLLPHARQLCASRLTSSFLRVNSTNEPDCRNRSIHVRPYHRSCVFAPARSYATAAPSRAGRPKAHTGRTTASTRKPAAPKTASTTRKTAAASKGGRSKPKPKPKPKRKAVKAAPKPKPARKAQSEKTKLRIARSKAFQEEKSLREKALLHPPRNLPATAWAVVFTEAARGKDKAMKVGESARQASRKYKSLTPEEHERYNHIANENKAKNEVTYRKWVNSFSPLQIKEANNARNLLKRHAKAAGRKKQYKHIQDDRLVKQPNNPYSLFFSDRYASGDMKGMKVGEVGGLVGREWKALTEAERKPFQDKAAEERRRYHMEFRTVYGIEPPSMTHATATA